MMTFEKQMVFSKFCNEWHTLKSHIWDCIYYGEEEMEALGREYKAKFESLPMLDPECSVETLQHGYEVVRNLRRELEEVMEQNGYWKPENEGEFKMVYNVKGKVLKVERVDSLLDLILVDKGTGYHPFVTWLYNREDEAPFGGHYYKTREEAERDFENRMAHYRAG